MNPCATVDSRQSEAVEHSIASNTAYNLHVLNENEYSTTRHLFKCSF